MRSRRSVIQHGAVRIIQAAFQMLNIQKSNAMIKPTMDHQSGLVQTAIFMLQQSLVAIGYVCIRVLLRLPHTRMPSMRPVRFVD